MAPTAGGASTLVWGSGMLLVVGGMAAVTYSLITHRSDLWNLGLSLALAGQAVLILGMVLRLESRARRSSSSQARVEQRPGTGREGDQGPLAAPPGTIRRVDSASLSQASLDLASVQRQLDLIAYRLQRPVPPRD